MNLCLCLNTVKQHGLYYLSTEKNEYVSDDYPPANDPKIESYVNEADDLAKLTEQSLVLKRRSNHMKPRPVVVKLDEADMAPVLVKRPEPEENSLSGAVRDVLLGSETMSSWSQSISSDKSSGKRKEKKKLSTDLPSEMKENLGYGDKPDPENPNPRSKHRNHNKERRRRSQEKIVEEGEEHEQRGKKKSSHRHGRYKTRQRANTALNVASQTPVIPDFLL